MIEEYISRTQDTQAGLTTPPCVHHWVIEEPDGEYSNGQCKHCGSVRSFLNWNIKDVWINLEEYNALRTSG